MSATDTGNGHVQFIWGIAELLRGDYRRSEYGRVVLPFTVLRRLARNAEELRYDSDYRLGGATLEEARSVLSQAEEFVAAVGAIFE